MASDRIANLSPEKRQLLERLLRKRADGRPQAVETASAPHPRPAGAALALSYAQQRMWFLARSDPQSPAYNLPLALRLYGRLDVDALSATLNRIVQRHEVLRTAFPDEDGTPRPFVAAALPIELEQIWLDQLSPEDAKAEVIRLTDDQAARPLDVTKLPLLCATLFHLSADDHVFMLVFHHIIFDGWSIDVLLRDFGILYPALAAGQPYDLPPLTLQYADYTYWERASFNNASSGRLLEYWQTRLADAPAGLAFPGSSSLRGARPQYTGSLPVAFGGEMYADLKTFCQEQSLTPFIVLLAALKATLQRFCGTDDMVIGTQSVNRGHQELEDLIGLFINPLALRTDLSGRPGFVELCHRVRDTVAGAFTHQDMPFDQLVRMLQVHTGGRHPLFNVVFHLRTQSTSHWDIGDLTVELLTSEGNRSFTPKFDLVLSMVDTTQALEGSLEYDPTLFSEDLMVYLHEAYGHLLRQALDSPEVPVSDLNLVLPARRQMILNEWNRTTAPYPDHSCVHQLFDATADRQPDHAAIAFPGQTMSYGALDRQANQLAHYLVRNGLGPERIAAFYLERSPELIITILAIFKTGGAFLAMDPHYASERLERILANSQPVVLITQERFLATLPLTEITVICLDRHAGAIAHQPDARPSIRVAPDSLAYLIYTSGSTGTPKGVMGHHRGICNLSEAQVRTFDTASSDRILQLASLTFDAFLWELVMAWRVGATLQLAPWEDLLPGPGLAQLLSQEHVTMLTIPPSILSAVPTADLPALHTLIVAGEACPADLVARWAPGRRMINAYGPTETTVWATYDPCVVGEAPPIGRAITNLRVYLLDAHLDLVPPGMLGEVYIGGVGLARGYLGQPDLTAERFIPDPFAAAPGARLYRTGDLGYYLPDGRIQFESRADDQVKIRGFRVEPGEIQRILAAYPPLEQVYVMAVERQAGQPRLVAWYVAQANVPPPAPAALRAWIESQLPRYMWPTAYVQLERFPLTAHGKIDRRRLPPPDWEALARDHTPTAEPQGPVEQTLARIWSDVLELSQVGREDNFFELGGDSILSIQIVSRANQAGIGLQAHQIFESPTIADLAAIAQPMSTREAAQPSAQAPRKAHTLGAEAQMAPMPLMATSYELSPLQEGLLYHCLRAQDRALYVLQFNLTLRGGLNPQALLQAWQTVLDRHDTLRTSFTWEGVDSPVQRVHGQVTLPFQLEDWRHLTPDAQRQRWQQFQAEDLKRGFAFDRPPLLRCALFQVDETHHYFTWTSHHLLMDGWSFAIITDEVFSLYRALANGVELHLPTPEPYRHYIAWLRQCDRTMAQKYWQRTLAGCTEPTYLSDPILTEGEPSDAGPEVVQKTVAVPDEDIATLQAFCRQQHLTLNTLVQATWALVLSRYTGRADVLYGLTMSGRPAALPGVEHMVGLFINTLPFRTHIPRATAVGTWLAAVQRQLQELHRFEYSSLVEAQRQSAIPAGDPLFDTLVLFQNYPSLSTESAYEHALQIEGEPVLERTDYPLTLLVEPGAPFHLRFIYDRRALADTVVAHLASHVRHALTAIPETAERPVVAWSMLAAAERTHLLHAWNRTARDYAQDRFIHQYIEAQATRRPHQLAVVFEARALTYTELNRSANRLAHWLRSRGVGPESLVGVYAERSLGLVVALLAILKAGGSYLPLAIEYPQARLDYMLQQARPLVILTQRALRDRLPTLPAEVVLLDEEAPPWRHADVHNPHPEVRPTHPAYVIYTSGSTGEPKGVMNTHEGILNRILWVQEAYPIGPGDRVLQKTPYSFDVSVWEFFWPLMMGARLVVARPDGHRDSTYLTEVITREEITVLHFVPSMLQVFLEDVALIRQCETLRLVICSGEALTPSLRDRFFSVSDAELLNLYGPTEAAVDVTHWLCQRGSRDAVVPIGWPIANIRMHILDLAGHPCPVGVPGELHIGGIGLARGYLARPDLTAERFVPDPFSKASGQRLYRTGDLACYRTDGRIEYLGRLDFQLKIRGQRIELGEIEENLRAHPMLRDAVVLCRDVQAGDMRLVAYVASDEGDHAALRAFLAHRLPEYMIPSHVVTLDALPLNLSGKVDRQALPVSTLPRATVGGPPFVPPRDALERDLAELWASLLQCDRVGLRDQFFFDLGGHSLLALRLLSQVKRQWPSAFTLADFLRDPTVEGTARLLRGAAYGGSAAQPPLVPIQSMGSRPPLFLVHPALGTVLGYYELARALGSEQPIYAFQAPGLDGQSDAINDIRELARRYLAAMRQVQPRGPYRLGGYSFGGIVAFEMAQQVIADNEDVTALVIFDTLAPAGGVTAETEVVDEVRLLAEIAGILERYHGFSPSIVPAELVDLGRDERLDQVRRRLRQRGALRGLTEALHLEGLLAVNRAAVEALSQYRLMPYPGRIALIRSANPSPEDLDGVDPQVFADPSFGWQQWSTRAVDVRYAPGDHVSFMQPPGVAEVAQLLEAILS